MRLLRLLHLMLQLRPIQHGCNLAGRYVLFRRERSVSLPCVLFCLRRVLLRRILFQSILDFVVLYPCLRGARPYLFVCSDRRPLYWRSRMPTGNRWHPVDCRGGSIFHMRCLGLRDSQARASLQERAMLFLLQEEGPEQ